MTTYATTYLDHGGSDNDLLPIQHKAITCPVL